MNVLTRAFTKLIFLLILYVLEQVHVLVSKFSECFNTALERPAKAGQEI